jgi:hypothetical protein
VCAMVNFVREFLVVVNLYISNAGCRSSVFCRLSAVAEKVNYILCFSIVETRLGSTELD